MVVMHVARDGWPFIVGLPVVLGLLALGANAAGWPATARGLGIAAAVGCGFMLFFFRDPDREPPSDPDAVLSGADGVVMEIAEEPEPEFIGGPAVRISVFLSVFNVHVNRAPVAGRVTALKYTPGRFLFAFDNRASRVNENNSILIDGGRVRCLTRQIVGPVARRVVHWLAPNQELQKGDRIGMMKFGSRLDVYLPKGSAEIVVKKGDRVRAGETVMARLVTPDAG